MANSDKKISALETISPVQDSDRIPVSSNDSTKAVSAEKLAAFTNNKLFDSTGRVRSNLLPLDSHDVVGPIYQLRPAIDIDNFHIGPNSYDDGVEGVAFNKRANRLLLYVPYESRYYCKWNDFKKYGGSYDDDGVIPYEGKIYWLISNPVVDEPAAIHSYVCRDGQLVPLDNHDQVILPYRRDIDSTEELSDGSPKYSIHRLQSQTQKPYPTDAYDAIVYDTATTKFYLCEDGITPGSYFIYGAWHGSDPYSLSSHNSFRIFYNCFDGTYRRWDGTALVRLSDNNTPVNTFDDLFLAICANAGAGATPFGSIIVSDDGVKIYRLNGLDLSYQEAVAVITDKLSMPPYLSSTNGLTNGARGRTNIPFYPAVLDRCIFLAPSLEVIAAAVTPATHAIVTSPLAIDRCTNTHTIIGKLSIRFDASDSTVKFLRGCTKLVNADFDVYSSVASFDISDCKALSSDSIMSIVSNSAVRANPLTVKVHADVFNKLQSTWSDIVTAATDKYISFVTA